jgi:hypothetical protein
VIDNDKSGEFYDENDGFDELDQLLLEWGASTGVLLFCLYPCSCHGVATWNRSVILLTWDLETVYYHNIVCKEKLP